MMNSLRALLGMSSLVGSPLGPPPHRSRQAVSPLPGGFGIPDSGNRRWGSGGGLFRDISASDATRRTRNVTAITVVYRQCLLPH